MVDLGSNAGSGSTGASFDCSTPAVVYGCFRQGGIGIVRSLGRIGVPVYTVDLDRFEAAFFSRYCRGSFRWDVNGASADESVRFLHQVGEKIGRRALLIPTSDAGAMFLAAEAPRLDGRFLFPEQNANLTRSLCSKREMHDLAKRLNIPTPHTFYPTSREDMRAYLESARFPILVKPVSNERNAGKSWRMFLAHSRGELLERYDSINDGGQPGLVLQEYIPGPDCATWTFNGYFDRDSNCLAAFTGRKLRNFPSYFGRASLAVCQRNDEVERMAVHFMKCIGYKGPLDIGFRYDSRDGCYKVNDINPRVGSMFRLFVGENGADIVRAMYCDLTGQPFSYSSAKEGRKWITEDVDWISAVRYWRDGNLSLKEWYRSLQGIRETAFLARDDYLPFAAACIQDVSKILKAGLRHVRERLYQSPPHEYRKPAGEEIRQKSGNPAQSAGEAMNSTEVCS
jgi:predicted ATP-grasp superfamily ATP-dependent carboligase